LGPSSSLGPSWCASGPPIWPAAPWHFTGGRSACSRSWPSNAPAEAPPESCPRPGKTSTAGRFPARRRLHGLLEGLHEGWNARPPPVAAACTGGVLSRPQSDLHFLPRLAFLQLDHDFTSGVVGRASCGNAISSGGHVGERVRAFAAGSCLLDDGHR